MSSGPSGRPTPGIILLARHHLDWNGLSATLALGVFKGYSSLENKTGIGGIFGRVDHIVEVAKIENYGLTRF
jgi:hypothetical protein